MSFLVGWRSKQCVNSGIAWLKWLKVWERAGVTLIQVPAKIMRGLACGLAFPWGWPGRPHSNSPEILVRRGHCGGNAGRLGFGNGLDDVDKLSAEAVQNFRPSPVPPVTSPLSRVVSCLPCYRAMIRWPQGLPAGEQSNGQTKKSQPCLPKGAFDAVIGKATSSRSLFSTMKVFGLGELGVRYKA